jgi:hypothetical protein
VAQRAPLPDPVLEQFAHDHIRYEVVTIADIASTYADQHKTTFERCYLESLLIHVRLVDEFLAFALPHAGKVNEDDVRAIDYLGSWAHTRPLNAAERDDIGAYVAHLTTRRTTGKQWLPVELAHRTLHHFEGFVDAVAASPADAHRAPWLRWPQVAGFLAMGPGLTQPGGGW